MLKTKDNTSSEKTGILSEIEKISDQMIKNEQLFNLITDDLLIESLIYEQISLKHRYAHLLKTAKEKGITVNFIDKL